MGWFNPDAEPGFEMDEVAPRVVRQLRDAAEWYEREEAEGIDRFLVVLMTPDVAQYYGFGREEPGLKLFDGVEWCGDPTDLDDARGSVSETAGTPVDLVEHHEGGLWYWTATARALQPA